MIFGGKRLESPVFVILGNKKIGANSNGLFFIPLIILALRINAFGPLKVSKLFSGTK